MRRSAKPLFVLWVLALAALLCGCGGSGVPVGSAGPGDGAAVKPPPPPPPDTESKIAFQRYLVKGTVRNTNQIFTINTDSTGLRQVTASYSNAWPSWGPDGRICFVSYREGTDYICVVNKDGTGFAALTSPPGGPGDDTPDWCPSTPSKIVFTRRLVDYNSGDLYTQPVGGEATQLTDAAIRETDTYPSWSPDGAFVVFTRLRTSGGQLYVAQVSNGEVWPLAYDGTDMMGYYPDWSPDGMSIVYTAAGIRRIPMNKTTGQASGPAELVYYDANLSYHPTFSPAGDALVYGTGQIRIFDLATQGVTDLTQGDYPDWSLKLP